MKKYFMPIGLILFLFVAVVKVIWTHIGFKYIAGEPLSSFAPSMTHQWILLAIFIIALILFAVGMIAKKH